jgi:long-chain acyl-CoA synthetase
MLSRLCQAPLVLFHRFDAGEYLRMVERWQGTHSILALTAYIAILNHPDVERRDISSLNRVFTGGAPVSPAVVDRFEAVTGQYMHNTYGMTETSCATHIVPYGMRAPIDPASGALAVGLPAPNVEAKVVGLEDGKELPAGEIGEINSMGPTVVPGYWNNPEQTAHALRDGFMHTGDVGIRDEDGWFYLVDRAKDLIVASGYKVWPREVEDVIYEHPAVREVAVVGVADEYRGETVKAFVSLKPGVAATPAEIIDHCRAVMAAYKYPRSVEIVDELPKTVTGKLTRRTLREKADPRPRTGGLPPTDQRVVLNEEDGLYAK